MLEAISITSLNIHEQHVSTGKRSPNSYFAHGCAGLPVCRYKCPGGHVMEVSCKYKDSACSSPWIHQARLLRTLLYLSNEPECP